jgi:hypothetical protein
MDRRQFIRLAGITGSAVAMKATDPLIAGVDGVDSAQRGDVDLSPARWSAADRERYLDMELEFNGPHPRATGTRGMVAGTSNPFAIHSGLLALQQGGSAADAALCTALTQVALMFGAATSYAGGFNDTNIANF